MAFGKKTGGGKKSNGRPNTIVGNMWDGGKGSLAGSISLNLDNLKRVLSENPSAVQSSEYGKQIKIGVFESKNKTSDKSPDFFLAVFTEDQKSKRFETTDDDVPF